MKWLFIILMLMTSWVFAQDIKVELNPPKPVAGENFTLNFTIPTVGDDEVDISFTPPQSVEVLGRNTEGVSIQSVIINGRVTMKREVAYSYDMRADHVGYFRIKDIHVEQNKKKTKVPDISFSVVKEREKAKDVFLLAQVSKNKVFVGEGIDVTYYIYQKVQAGFQTTDFPKLNHFTKRDKIKDRGPEERVDYYGEVFARTALLQSRIFPQKVGKLSVDSMRGIAKIVSMPNLWGGGGAVREKNVYSVPVEIEVMPIPSTNVPKDFTGLVGEHDFKLSINKTKFLTNEVVELKLIVQGYGALESFDGPKIYQDSNLEEFEVKSEIQDPLATKAVKVFDYTYLTRGATLIPAKKLSFSYFDPSTASFKTKTVDVPAITVAGGAAPSVGQNITPPQPDKANDTGSNEPKFTAPKKTGILAPIFSDNGMEKKYFLKNNWIIILNFILVLAIVGFGGMTFYKRDKSVSEDSLASQMVDEIKNKGINYSRLHKLLSLLRREHSDDDDATLNRLIEEAELSTDVKAYFKKLITLCEHMGYNSEEAPLDYVFEKKHFKELIGLVSKRRIK